jgi:hypothetical protein
MNGYANNQLPPKELWLTEGTQVVLCYDANTPQSACNDCSIEPFVFDADYIVIQYQFTDGNDLDTRTRMVIPNIGQTDQTTYLGWSRQTQWPTSGAPILRWGGDNTGTGLESVLVDIIRFKQLYPFQTSITIDLRAFWYGTIGSNPVILNATLYKGGTITGPTNFTFGNSGYTDILTVPSASKQITLSSQANTTSGQRVGTLNYNVSTGAGSFDVEDVTTPSV